MTIVRNKNNKFFLRILHGALIGLGAVLPGVSGGVLCVIFGVYKPIMEVLSHPFKAIKKHLSLLVPLGLGIVVGFLGISKLLGFLLERFESPSICLFAGLILGMLPSLFKEAGEKGRRRGSWISLVLAAVITLSLLVGLKLFSFEIAPNIIWYLFCGFCVALSVIAPGMSFSTLLMPLGLYTPLLNGIGDLDFSVILPMGLGALLTVILLARAVDSLMTKHYSVAFHAIIGIVISATAVIIPYKAFTLSLSSGILCGAFIIVGILLALLLDKFNKRFEGEK